MGESRIVTVAYGVCLSPLKKVHMAHYHDNHQSFDTRCQYFDPFVGRGGLNDGLIELVKYSIVRKGPLF